MKYLKAFKDKLSEMRIARICNSLGIENWSINKDGLVDVRGNVNIISKETKLPLNFGYVTGNFDCNISSYSIPYTKLTTLEGSPRRVDGNFDCQFNSLTDLKGAPTEVGGYFRCSYNPLTSLEGAPRMIGGDFHLHYEKLKSFRFSPEEIGGKIYCRVDVSQSHSNTIEIQLLAKSPNFDSNLSYVEFIIKNQAEWRIYRKDGTINKERFEQMIEWGLENNRIEPLVIVRRATREEIEEERIMDRWREDEENLRDDN
jgi:hypothetical protein